MSTTKGVNIAQNKSFLLTTSSIVLMMICGWFYNVRAETGNERIAFMLLIYLFFQLVYWVLAKRGRFMVAFAGSFLFAVVFLTINAAFLLWSGSETENQISGDAVPASDIPVSAAAFQAVGTGGIFAMVLGYFWMALDFKRLAETPRERA